MNEWKWYGNAGHFCNSRRCRFHLCTEVGDYLISTVGEYYPSSSEEMESLGIEPNGFYETMIFKWSGRCSCGCGLPEINPSHLHCERYETPKDANEGHLRLCNEFDSLRPTKTEET